MIFAHTNGVVSQSVYVPREIQFMHILTLKSKGGVMVNVSNLPYTAKDVASNNWIYHNNKGGGLKYPQCSDGLDLDDVPAILMEKHRDLGGKTVYVKGPSQKKCLESLMAGVKIVDLDCILPLYDALHYLPSNYDESHVSKYHFDKYKCSQVVVYRYCLYIQENMDILNSERITR